ncbi:viral A-type inclusion protein [Reticulomyxa filosa]|uniref:Viral A-type inclusion protein n=1 Tax=Reticulomyxa filosa TaxID=46433 RepID=X6NXB1_RETFI|nr:viral A-type inclusion protein [Reticulomyxa filosa]|eukprot:ETO29897.1 viral A-type inclusion protein [Reticulomyxa filosa]
MHVKELEEFEPINESPKESRPSNLISGRNEITLRGDQINQLRNEMMAEMNRLHLQSMREMVEREEKLRWNVKLFLLKLITDYFCVCNSDETIKQQTQDEKKQTNLMTEEMATNIKSNDLEKMQQEMMMELHEITKREINNRFEKQFQLRALSNTNEDNANNENIPNSDIHHSEENLEKLREDMLNEFNNAQRTALNALFERQTKIRWTGYDNNNLSNDSSLPFTKDTKKDKNISPNDNSNNNEKKKQEETDICSTPEFKNMKSQLEEKITELNRQFEDEQKQKDELQQQFKETMNNYESKLIDVTNSKNALQHEIARLTDSKVILIKTISWELNNLRYIYHISCTPLFYCFCTMLLTGE